MKTIPGFEAYMITEDGRVWSTIYNKFMKPYVHKSEYLYIKLVVTFKHRTSVQIHRLVANTYLPQIEGKDFINHKDGNKLNNNLDNLEWCSRSENQLHAVAEGLHIGRGKQRINDKKKKEIIELWNLGISRIKIGIKLELSTSTVGRYLKQQGLVL